MSFFSRTKKGPVVVKEPFTLLGAFLKTNGVQFPINEYDGKTVTFESPNYPLKKERATAVFGQYEAALTQACYFSRLIYSPNEVAAMTAQFVHYNPVVLNTALSIIRGNYSRIFADQPTAKQLAMLSFNPKRSDTPIVKVPNSIRPENKDGLFLNGRGLADDTPCWLQYLDYSAKKTNVPYPEKRILYITFRGTLTLGGAIADANVASLGLENLLTLCTLGGMSGLDAFKEEVAAGKSEGSRGIAGVVATVATAGLLSTNPFGAHQGFVRQMKNVMGAVCEALDKKFLKLPIDHIIVTGHSLGAANATLASLVLGGFKRAANISTNMLQFGCLRTATLHCITFGGPKLLTDYSRNVYNTLLTGGIMTLDRIANRASAAKQAFSSLSFVPGTSVDWVPLIPANFNHPGFMPGKAQFYTQSKMGMSNNISDLRQMFAGITPPSSLSFYGGTFNGIPLYKEFLDCFMRIDVIKKNSTKYDINTVYEKIIGKTGTLGFWQKSSFPGEYAAIKALVEQVLAQPVVEETKESVEAETIADKAATTPPPAAVAAEKTEAAEVPTAAEGDLTAPQVGGDHTSEYKLLRDTKAGSNQITYSPQMVVSPVSAHLNYMGVGWNGAVKDLQHIRYACQEIRYGNTPIKPYCVAYNKLTGRNVNASVTNMSAIKSINPRIPTSNPGVNPSINTNTKRDSDPVNTSILNANPTVVNNRIRTNNNKNPVINTVINPTNMSLTNPGLPARPPPPRNPPPPPPGKPGPPRNPPPSGKPGPPGKPRALLPPVPITQEATAVGAAGGRRRTKRKHKRRVSLKRKRSTR